MRRWTRVGDSSTVGIRGAGPTALCYDATTTWPPGYEPPPIDCTAWGGPLTPGPEWVAELGELSDTWRPGSATLDDDIYVGDRGP
jgi:hypothetical protein